MAFVDTAQYVIPLVGLPALYLTTRGNRWGAILGCIAQPLWIYCALARDLYGMAVVEACYAAIWARQLWVTWLKKPAARSTAPDGASSTS